MCTAFSSWQRINDKIRDPAVCAAEKARALVHLSFCVELYREQLKHNRYFVHEHPASATSWQSEVMESLAAEPGVVKATCDQCQYGMDDLDGNPIRKPTTFLTKAAEIAGQLTKRCNGRSGQCSRKKGGFHRQCRGQVARLAAVYHFKLCRAILVGMRRQLDRDGKTRPGDVGMLDDGWDGECADHGGDARQLVGRNGCVLNINMASSPFRDDLTGQPLDEKLVREARQKELDYFESKGVWRKAPIAECRRNMGRSPISVRWVDVNKGDDIHPNIRSRLVARQIRGPGEEATFAPTPPLETLRFIISMAATDLPGRPAHSRDPESDERTQISAIDISRAYFNASTEGCPPTYVQLPDEHPEAGRGMCGFLLKHMYGTQAAADGWQQEYAGYMIEIGFVQGAASPCVFTHPSWHIMTSVHGDDFTSCGTKRALDWLESKLEARYELRKGGRLGPGANDSKEITVLNRVIRWTDAGLEYEADPRQCERLLEGLQLDDSCNGVATPGLKPLPQQIEAEEVLPPSEQTEYRGLAARANYVSADRVDLQYSSKECCRFMSAPGTLAQGALKRLGRYVLKHKRLVYKYPWQEATHIDVYGDTDWAGCPRTRKSTSGGALMIGAHTIRTYSSTQTTVSLSSGEAEYYGLVKGAAAGLGHQAIMADYGVALPVRLWTDSSAALGISKRSGLGKIRHLDTHTLWLQEKVRTKAVEVRKVKGEENPADMFTKYLPSKDQVHSLVKMFGCEYRDGRAESAPLLRPLDQPRPVHNVDAAPVLPHLRSDEDIDRLYPQLEAPEELIGPDLSEEEISKYELWVVTI